MTRVSAGREETIQKCVVEHNKAKNVVREGKFMPERMRGLYGEFTCVLGPV
jgi:hypothetical protein